MALRKTLSIPALAAALALAVLAPSRAEPEPARFGYDAFIGEIALFAGNFAPHGWALCDGQVLSIPQHTALYSLLGNTYGGDGKTTFALPDLRGRVPMHAGTGHGLTPRKLGQKVGAEKRNILLTQMPSHSHNLLAFSGDGRNDSPKGDVLAKVGTRLYSPETPDIAMNGLAIGQTGGEDPLEMMQPSLAINYIIALQGIYPSRD